MQEKKTRELGKHKEKLEEYERHYGKDKVYMDFAILAMSLNLKKLIKNAA